MSPHSALSGILAGLGAFLIWGGLVLYWYPLSGIPAVEILAHRVFWSLLTVFPLVLGLRRFAEVRAALALPRLMLRVSLSAVIIACNWGLYIWAVTNGYVLESSLGYFINPLVNVLLGMVFLSERPSRLQAIALAIATLGVLWSVFAVGTFPWIGLGLAFSFGLYGLCRKTVQVESVPGLFLETAILFPLALAWLLWLHSQGQGHFFSLPWQLQLLLAGTGVATSFPLLLFAYAARHMPLSTLGLLQYVSPSMVFVIGIFMLGESVTSASLITFGCIWIALALYTWCAVLNYKKR